MAKHFFIFDIRIQRLLHPWMPWTRHIGWDLRSIVI